MAIFPYRKSAKCTLAIDEVADVAISVHSTDVVWGLMSLPGIEDYDCAIIAAAEGSYLGFSIAPLSMSKSTLSIEGIAKVARGHGPVLRQKLILTLFIWAAPSVARVTLGTDRSIDVRFCFGDASQLSSADPTKSLVKPWENAAGGTTFDWPK